MLLLMISELVTQNPERIGMWTMLLGIAYYAARHFWGKRNYEKTLKKVEAKIESDEDSSIGRIGRANPGRSTVELVEVLHEDFKEFRTETRQTLKEHGRQIGRIEGRLEIKED